VLRLSPEAPATSDMVVGRILLRPLVRKGRVCRNWAYAFVVAALAHASCGGSVGVSDSGGEAVADGAVDGGRLNESSDVGSCSANCPDVLNGTDASSASEGPDGITQDAATISDGSLVCGYHTGPLPPGADAGGPSVVCSAGWMCTNLNGGWACCTIVSSAGGGLSNCVLPFFTGGG
jgi:hypothetical protein